MSEPDQPDDPCGRIYQATQDLARLTDTITGLRDTIRIQEDRIQSLVRMKGRLELALDEARTQIRYLEQRVTNAQIRHYGA